MKNDYYYISDPKWFDDTSLKNPIQHDHTLETYFPEFYAPNYDTRLLASPSPSLEEKTFPFYNDYRERYGSTDIQSLHNALVNSNPKCVFLNGFNQKQFLFIAPKIKDTAEVIYFFKCPQIKDLSVLSQFKNLKCVHIFWNSSLETLWDMKDNRQLKVISFDAITKLRNIESLRDSSVEYLRFDSSDNSGNTKPILFDPSVLDQMPQLKHISLVYTGYCIER